MIKKAAALVGTAAAALSLTFVASPAFASADSPVSAAQGCPGDPNGIGGTGWFQAYGDKFASRDECKDGHSVTLYADARPYKSGNGYDFKFQNTLGKEGVLTKSHNLPEETEVRIRVCVTEGTTALRCGPWETGNA